MTILLGTEQHEIECSWLERVNLRIRLDEPHSLAPFSHTLRESQHRSRQVDPYNCAVDRRMLLRQFAMQLAAASCRLRSVDIHVMARKAVERWMKAVKLSSVLS
jgi:hypothetical protein